jgi:hypothetical protein
MLLRAVSAVLHEKKTPFREREKGQLIIYIR